MNPESGWEKGNVENKVGYIRRNFLVPSPRFTDLADFNKGLLEEADRDMEREHYHYDQTIRERYEEDRRAFLSLPDIALTLPDIWQCLPINGDASHWNRADMNTLSSGTHRCECMAEDHCHTGKGHGYAASSDRYAPAALWGTETVQYELAALSEIHFQKAKITVP